MILLRFAKNTTPLRLGDRVKLKFKNGIYNHILETDLDDMIFTTVQRNGILGIAGIKGPNTNSCWHDFIELTHLLELGRSLFHSTVFSDVTFTIIPGKD